MKTSIKRVAVLLTVSAVTLAGCGGQDEPGTTTPAGAPASAAATSAAPAGNGVADLEGKEILDRARAALTAAKSFQMAGKLSNEGQTITLDFRISGEDLVGEMEFDGAAAELLLVGDQYFIRPDAKFWEMSSGGNKQQAQQIAKLMGDKWVKVPESEQSFKSFFTIADVDELLKSEGTVTKGETKDVDGTPAIALAQRGDDGKLWIATTGEPYPLRLEGATAKDGALTFGKFGETFSDLKVPTAAEFIDFGKLQG